MKNEYYVEYRPDNGMGVDPRDIGPFPFETWALGWAFMEMKGEPLGWWSVQRRKKYVNPKKKLIKTRNS